MDQGRNSLSCEMCSCLLFMNSHAILTTSSSLNERCVEDDEEAGAVLPAATASAAAAAIVNSFRPMDQGEGGGGGRESFDRWDFFVVFRVCRLPIAFPRRCSAQPDDNTSPPLSSCPLWRNKFPLENDESS